MVLPEAGKTKTPWLETERTEFPKLDENAQCDVLIVGAGIAGLSCAYMLAKEGKDVIVVDSGRMCSGETQRTTAHLADYIDDTYTDVISLYGEDKAKLVRESYTAAIDKIEEIVQRENIDCDFERLDGFLFEAKDGDTDLQEERESGLKAGLARIDYIESLPQVGGAAALRYPGQAQIHSVKYLNGICKALGNMGVKIYQESRVQKIDDKGEKKIRPQAELKNGCTIDAKDIIVATNGPIIDFSIQTKQTAYRTFAVALRIPVDAVPKGLYWDTLDPYHYTRLQPIDGDEKECLLITGGEDHHIGEANDAEERFERLIAWTKETFKVDGEVSYK